MSDRTKDREAVEALEFDLDASRGLSVLVELTQDHAECILALARAHLAMLEAGPVGYAVKHPDGTALWNARHYANAYDQYARLRENGDDVRLLTLYALPEDSDG